MAGGFYAASESFPYWVAPILDWVESWPRILEYTSVEIDVTELSGLNLLERALGERKVEPVRRGGGIGLGTKRVSRSEIMLLWCSMFFSSSTRFSSFFF
jgi:hypothetical protein